MTTRTCGRSCKDYRFSFLLSLSDSTFSISIFLLKDLNKLSKPLVLSGNPTHIPDALFIGLFVDKYTKENLQHILKIVLKA